MSFITDLGNIKGAKGDRGVDGQQGIPGSNAVGNVTAVAAYISNPVPTALQVANDANSGRRRTLGFYAAAGKAAGIADFKDTKQPLTRFGNAPGSVVGGALVHTPIAGSSAAYWETNLGETVGHLRAVVEYPATTAGVVALIGAKGSWAARFGGSGFPDGACHFRT
jgi:hypothetical protein